MSHAPESPSAPSVRPTPEIEGQVGALALASRSALRTCAWCKKPMRKEPFAPAWVHADTGSILCAQTDLIQPEQTAKVRWPHIERSPRHVAHLRGIIARLETAMMPNTKAATLACLDELLRRLEADSPNT